MSTEVIVSTIPDCQMCAEAGRRLPAIAEAKLHMGTRTPWAYVCREHFDTYGCQLGTGHGQRLILAR